jgi:hypothetical protein
MKLHSRLERYATGENEAVPGARSDMGDLVQLLPKRCWYSPYFINWLNEFYPFV